MTNSEFKIKSLEDAAEQREVSQFLDGERLYLRALAESDADGPYIQWLNDEKVCEGNSHHIYPYSKAQAVDYIRGTINAHHELVLAVVLKQNHRHIGNIALQRINWVYRSAEFSILLGDRENWGKGYGLEAARMLIQHGFKALQLERISCGTFETNEGMKRLALALGMKKEGLRRKAAFKGGKYLDVVEYGLLKEEFKNI